MKGSLTLAAQAMGGAFGPAIERVGGWLSSAAVKFGIFAEKHPGLMKFFGTILAGAPNFYIPELRTSSECLAAG